MNVVEIIIIIFFLPLFSFCMYFSFFLQKLIFVHPDRQNYDTVERNLFCTEVYELTKSHGYDV